MQAQSNAPNVVTISQLIRALPIVPIRPDAMLLAPSAISDAATKAAVDAKLNAALKERVKQTIGSSDATVGALVDGLSLDYHALLRETILSIIQKIVVPAMQRDQALAPLAPLATELAGRHEEAGAPTVESLLQPNVPLAQHPLFIDDVRQGRGRELLRISNLSVELVAKIDAGQKPLEAWNSFDWENAVKQNVLTSAERDNLLFSTELSRLTGQQYELVGAARKAALNSANDLVKWDQSHWLDLIKQNPTSIPEGITADAYAGAITKSVQQSYPSEYFAYRVADKASVQSLTPAALAGTYRHLGAGAEIMPRIDALGRFLQNNSDADLRYINLLGAPSADGGINWSGIAAADQSPVRNQLLAYQRVLTLAPDHDTTMALLGAGLDSSVDIVALGYDALKQRTGLDDAIAASVYGDAQVRSAQVTHGIQATKDALSAIEQGSYFQGINPSFVNELKDLPGYAELFGSTSYCDCEHCRSIFSPAAYFADLMYFIDSNITKVAFAGKLHHALRLDMRRGDLWKLPLTCDNTNTRVTQLTLVNEILESYLQRTLSINETAQALLGDRSTIGLPFHEPLERVRESLSDWKLGLGDVYEILNQPVDAMLKETLRLSDEEWSALVAAAPDTAWIRFTDPDHSKMPVVDFLGFSKLTREQLDALAATKIASGLSIVRIQVGNDIQSETEEVHGLADALLDRIGRLLRLWRKTGLTLTELDEVLQSARIADANPFAPQSLTGLARFLRFKQRLGLSVEALIAVIDHIPTLPMKPGAKSLGDQLGLPALLGTGSFPLQFHHARFNTINKQDTVVDPRLPVLLRIVGVAEPDLVALFTQYTIAFGFDANGNAQLTRDNIALLFGHVTLARALGLTPAELSTVVRQLLVAPANDFRSLDRIEQLAKWVANLKSLPFSIAEALSWIDPNTALVDDQTIKAALAGLDPAQDVRLLLPNALASTAGMTAEKTLIALAFARSGWEITSPSPVALLALGRDLARIAQLFSRLQIDAADAWFIAQYPALFGIADIRALKISDLVAIRHYRQLVSSSTLSSSQIQNLLWQYQSRAGANQPIAPSALFVTMVGLPLYAQALAQHPALALGTAPSFTSEAPVSSPLNDEEISLLATGYTRDATFLRSVFTSYVLPPTALDGIPRTFQIQSLCQMLGIQAASLTKLSARDLPGLGAAADLLDGILADKYPDPTSRDKNVTPHQQAIEVLKRDALSDYIIARSDQLKLKSQDDLYRYFLIDVEVSGCFETSRLVAALSSLQLYVHRCLIDLEQSADLAVLPLINAPAVSQQWEWRKNYRVWEANRKVFLYPENYLEPELRDNKTPLFKNLEDTLLQRKITLDAAETAYSEYLTGFSTLAQLKTAGVFCEYEDDKPIRHWFVARTQSDPYQYYLRSCDSINMLWAPWESIDLGINAPYVSVCVHLGRLYLFWVEITSMDKSRFINGNSVYRGIEHKLTLHYSRREHSGKWTPPQKKQLFPSNSAKILDNYPISADPSGFLGFLTGITVIDVDKKKTEDLTSAYRSSRTYSKVIAESNGPDQLLIHYYHNFLRGNVDAKDTGNNGIQRPISDADVERGYLRNDKIIRPGQNEPLSVPVNEYFIFALDLMRGDVSIVGYRSNYPTSQTTEDLCPTGGGEAVGIFRDENANPNSLCLMLGNYAQADVPLATDDMLESNRLHGLFPLASNTIPTSTIRDVLLVNDRPEETVVIHGNHQHWVQRFDDPAPWGKRWAWRVNTTLDSALSKALFQGGLEHFLTLDTQATSEGSLLFNIPPTQELLVFPDRSGLPFTGSFGDYYRELFFHIPWAIASQLNAEGQYREAKLWYEKIFNPTARADLGVSNPKHRVWQFRELRGVDVQMLKDMLTDPAPIKSYHEDPFNPFAIARLRLSAFQKAIVMKYVQNLIDWGDSLFTQETMESVNEATMLYVLAADILGPRPVSVGKCTTADEATLNYDMLGPLLEKGAEFVPMLESITWQIGVEAKASAGSGAKSKTLLGKHAASGYRQRAARLLPYNYKKPTNTQAPQRRYPHYTRQYLPAFCVPANDMLLALWDRIEDRLFKIRHCLDINGQHVSLALFQPPIDPMLLVRAKAAGLSIEDILAQQDEALPAYRFNYLIEKARQYANTVQSFGGALLAALEKKDAEQLTLLRSTHEQNLLKLQRSLKEQQLSEAQAQYDAAQSQQQNVQNRIDYYAQLVNEGLTSWETTEQVFKHTATGFKTGEGYLHMMAGIEFLIPKVGSPFAITFGGQELGNSAAAQAQWHSSMASVADVGAASAGLEASFQRRAQEWQQQLTLAREEMNQVTKQLLAAEIRVHIAERDLEVHDKQIDQAQELHDFYREKFTNVGLYTFLSAQLMRLYREAYQMAARVARQAERAYVFERDDANAVFIQPDNWQSDMAGLVAGERLLLQLQRMEQAYLDNNVREIEVTQPFSLMQIDPLALQTLRLNGSCTFSLEEPWFDLHYPGQYRRLLKSVRITIPCVVGPYTNVGATLQLSNSWVRRRSPDSIANKLEEMKPMMTSGIATSHAQNDAGVFELNFRDERYLPFEGAGAVSQWKLSLPSTLRLFDYGTISDVIVHLSYVARFDPTFVDAVEAGIIARLMPGASNPQSLENLQNGLCRLVSLRHDFPDAFYQLLNPPPGQTSSTSITLENKHFPAWLANQTLEITQLMVWPQAVANQPLDAGSFGLKVNGSNWIPNGAGSNQGTVSVAGSPIRSFMIEAGPNALDKTKLADLVLMLSYRVM